jgi:RNA-binding protein
VITQLHATIRALHFLVRAHPMQMSEKQKRHLRGLGHALKPVVMMGNAGLSDAVLAELSRALDDHELVKVRVRFGDRKIRDETIARLCEKSNSVLIKRIGNIALVYRSNPEKQKISLPGP